MAIENKNLNPGTTNEGISFGSQPTLDATKALSSGGSKVESAPAVNPNDLSTDYANVSGTIYNKSTHEPYSSAEDFFKASGKSSFNGLTFDTNYKAPEGFNATQQKAKNIITKAGLDEAGMNNGSAIRGLLSTQASGQTFKMADGSTYDSSGKQITPPTPKKTAETGSTLPPELQKLIPSNAAYDQQSQFGNMLKIANDYIKKLTDPSAQTQLVDTFNNARESVGLPAIEDSIASVQSAIMTSPDDIKNELQGKGGMVSQSQVEYLSSVRDKALTSRLNTLLNLQKVREDYVNEVVDLTGKDRSNTINDFHSAFDVENNILDTQKTMDATGATNRTNAVQFALDNKIKKPYYSVAGTVYNTSTGFAYGSPEEAALAGVDTTGWSNVQPIESAINPANVKSTPYTYYDQVSGSILKGTKYVDITTGKVIYQDSKGGESSTPPNGTLATGKGNYDISSYNSNPSYSGDVQQIASNILNNADTASASGIDDYIQSVSPNSPITGAMVQQASTQYGVDPTAILALIQKESNLGTSNVAKSNNNFGGITWTQSYQDSHPGATKGTARPANEGGNYVAFPSIQDGINAQADWLSKHQATDEKATDSNSQSILSETGLSISAFNYLTQGTTSLSRLSAGQRKQIMNEAETFLNSKGLDISTFQSQYKAYNDVLGQNITRMSKTKIMENEITGTLANLKTVAQDGDLGQLKWENVGKIWAGEQVNDPIAQKYAFHLQQLKNETAGYFAASQGKNSPDVIDNQDAEKAIKDGISSGSITALEQAVKASTDKMSGVLQSSLDTAHQSIWELFGVGDKYHGASKPKTDNTQIDNNSTPSYLDSLGVTNTSPSPEDDYVKSLSQ